MKRRGLWAACVILLVGVGVLVVGTGFAKDENAGAKCSEATLHGTYLVAQHGVITEGPNQGPFAVAGQEVYDGNGKVDAVYTGNFGGMMVDRRFEAQGTYTVKPNCTGANTLKTDGEPVNADLFIAPDGSMFTFVQTKPPELVASGLNLRGTAKRVAP